jgi:hypothetical protein
MTLGELIRQVAAECDTVDPRELAQYVAKSAPPRQLRDLFAEAIVDDCRQHLMGRRNDALNRPIRRTNHSTRLAHQRDWWADILAQGVHVGDGSWKTLGDCTLPDLKFLINQSMTNIARIQVHIDQYELLASMMRSRKASHVRDLPREVVERRWAA